MSFANQSPTTRYAARITTVDPTQPLVEAAIANKIIQISIITITPAFRWPVVGEQWMVCRMNGSWYLDSILPQTAKTTNTNWQAANPGDLILYTPTGVVHVEGSSNAPGGTNTDFDLWFSNNTLNIGQSGTTVTALVPGDLIPSAAASRTGCLLCDGSSYPITTYPRLSAAIRTTYGGVDSNHFYVPDLRGRLPLGAGTGTASNRTTWTLGQQPITGAGGEQAHVQTAQEMASHGHDIAIDTSGGYMASQHVNSIAYNGTGATGSQTGTADDRGGQWNSPNYGASGFTSWLNGFSGGGRAMNILPPVSVVNWFIVHG